ncbi:MAG TPA: tyrosinase family protein, partial [Verrucomicrobiae bacterium]|nr:tyrosinase family protein [Verrucomicrobiae bacterium]
QARSWAKINPPPKVPTAPIPSDVSMWDQCQHGTWYFAPWHRGYLMALEAQLRADIVAAGGPANWALPYWNYYNVAQMPKEFAIHTLPKTFPAGLGGQKNPLYLEDRFGPDGDGNIYIPKGAIDTNCLTDTDFTDSFGGGATPFIHFGNDTGDLENNPHNNVHVAVGGTKSNSASRTREGLMLDPNLAALDPIFYVHHSMIDAMWACWNVVKGNSNPTDPKWLKGSVPEFSMPWPKSQPWKYTPGNVTNIQQLNYTYDFLADASTAVAPFTPAPSHGGLTRLAARLAHLGGRALTADQPQTVAVARGLELLGASPTNLPVKSKGIQTEVRLNSKVQSKLTASLLQASVSATPDRVRLKLEGVKGTLGATVLNVYVNLPKGANPDDNPGLKAGSAGLFGLRQASNKDKKHGGEGLSFAMDITRIIDDLHLRNALETGSINVSVVPYRPLPPGADITIGRISVYRVTH